MRSVCSNLVKTSSENVREFLFHSFFEKKKKKLAETDAQEVPPKHEK